MTIDVPFICIDQPCQIMLWDDAWVGAYGPGLSQAVYYTQISTDDTWIGGPNISLAGMAFSDGGGTNGDGSLDAIFAGGATSDGNRASLYDDWLTETSPYSWTITFERTTIQEEPPTFYVCPLALDDMHERFDVSSAGETTVTVPGFCIDGVCSILLWNNAAMYTFEPGILWPVHYTQDSTDGSWINGPDLSLGGTSFGGGAGTNGDAISETVFAGGQTIAGGYVRLHDDDPGTETSSSEWTIEFVPDAYLTAASYFVYPLVCEHHAITATGETAVDVPRFCTHGVCTVLAWNDATMGAFGPGLDWPSFYTQDPLNSHWIGGPNVSIAGMAFSDGAGVNGDGVAQAVHEGGQTVSGGYARLYDDHGSEFSPLRWTAVFSPDAYLTEAAYYICAGSCLQVDAPIPLPVAYFPAVLREYVVD